VLRAPVADGTAADGSVRGFADLTSQPSFADALERLLPLRAGGTEVADVPRVGKASVVMFPSHPPPSHGPDDPSADSVQLAPPGLAWAVDGKEIDVGVGQSPKDLLALSRPSEALRTREPIARALRGLGPEASFAAVFAPPGCCKASGTSSAPLTVLWGRKGADGRASASVGDELLGQIIAQFMAP
jgi:hypothetical protein